MIGQGSHWCGHIGRAHRSNHVYFMLDFATGGFCQKCYDPEGSGGGRGVGAEEGLGRTVGCVCVQGRWPVLQPDKHNARGAGTQVPHKPGGMPVQRSRAARGPPPHTGYRSEWTPLPHDVWRSQELGPGLLRPALFKQFGAPAQEQPRPA